jgi:hypothetical protein
LIRINRIHKEKKENTQNKTLDNKSEGDLR